MLNQSGITSRRANSFVSRNLGIAHTGSGLKQDLIIKRSKMKTSFQEVGDRCVRRGGEGLGELGCGHGLVDY